MNSAATIFDQAHLLLATAQELGVAALPLGDLRDAIQRLRCYADHPACDEERRERALGAVLVLSTLAEAHPANRPTALAG